LPPWRLFARSDLTPWCGSGWYLKKLVFFSGLGFSRSLLRFELPYSAVGLVRNQFGSGNSIGTLS
jgi:hypothetical protein